MSFQNQNQMLVEDEDTKGTVIGIMRFALGRWGATEQQWPVNISAEGSADEVLKESGLVAVLQASNVKTVGIIVDADDNPKGRWESVKNFCRKNGFPVPNDCPSDGLIVDNVAGRRFGAWIMPNNRDEGMVENFCHKLVPENDGLWEFAVGCAADAKTKGAPYIGAHRYKAEIHTWLAWQAPPGERMGSAITNNILRYDSDCAKPFIKWFRELYQI
jgi:hypothetical protein